MESKTIFLCLERLDIGGVETAVYNQAITLNEKGHKVVVLAKPGLYTEKLEEEQILCIPFEFPVEDGYSFPKIKKMIELLKTYKADQVHVHQFPCIPIVYAACLMTGIPYVSYLHTGLLDKEYAVYDWFEHTFFIYKKAFPLFFGQAERIIAITPEAKEFHQKRYKIEEEKYQIIPNSLNFKTYETGEERKELALKKWFMISRFSKEKMMSIKNGIDLFIEYANKKSNSSLQLTIVGDGEKRRELEEYCKEVNLRNHRIRFYGSSNEVPELMRDQDVVIALDRCVLEALAMKKIAIISGYQELKGIVNKENIEQELQENFSGKGLETKTKQEIIETIESMSLQDQKNLVDSNYQYIRTRLDANMNGYIIEKPIKKLISSREKELLLNFLRSENENMEKNKFMAEKEDNILNLKRELIYKNSQIRELEEKCQLVQAQCNEAIQKTVDVEKELNEVYHSKRWILSGKIVNIFRRKPKNNQ